MDVHIIEIAAVFISMLKVAAKITAVMKGI